MGLARGIGCVKTGENGQLRIMRPRRDTPCWCRTVVLAAACGIFILPLLLGAACTE